MYEQVEKLKSYQSETAPSRTPQQKTKRVAAFQIVSNRPEALVQQTAGESTAKARTDNITSSRQDEIIQRFVNIKTRKPDPNGYSFLSPITTKREWDNIWKNIQKETGNRFQSLNEAKKSPDRIIVEYNTKDQEYYPTFIENKKTEDKGLRTGWTRHVLNYPSYAKRPNKGYEELQLSGLHNCVAVVVEQQTENGIGAIAMSHFNTPEGIQNGTELLTKYGKDTLMALKKLIPPTNGKVYLRWQENNKSTGNKDVISGEDAATIISKEMTTLGFESIEIKSLTGESCKFKLSSTGNTSWT